MPSPSPDLPNSDLPTPEGSDADRPDAAAPLRWHDAFAESELWEGDITDVEIDGDDVLVVRLAGDRFKAYQAMCPHQEIALADGELDEDSLVLTCPGHHWQFDLNSGSGINPTGCTLYEFPVEVVDNRVRIGVPQDGARHYNRRPAD